MSINATVSAIYQDRISTEHIFVQVNDEFRALTRIRGVVFRSKSGIEWMTPACDQEAEAGGFVLSEGNLWDCEFTLEIPVWINTDLSALTGWIAPPSDYSERRWEFREPMPSGQARRLRAHVSCGIADPEETSIVLVLGMSGLRVESSGDEGCFEYELKNLQTMLPEYGFSFDDSFRVFSWG